jgi:prepilin-type processing-associated H-X9-DG protein/prepilin-type N-terminal cleavage/methylation domain-containing protein
MPLCVASRERSRRTAFTLIELLVVVAIIGLLVSILVPSLSAARKRAQRIKCLSQMRAFGQGIGIYVNEYADVLPPSRLPKIGDCDSWAILYGRKKYRPTFVAVLSTAVGVPPFDDPKACKTEYDMYGQRGDRQDYSYPVYVCPTVRDWTDERNGSIGFNYQFLGNSRLIEDRPGAYKNWPVQITWVRHPGRVILAGDCMGTAASLPPGERGLYDNNSRDDFRYGNEGFNLDPPRVDPVNGEGAGFHHDPQRRSAADPRHAGKANMLWVDGHCSSQTMEELGYQFNPDGSVGYDGDNSWWSLDGRDVPWTYDYQPR